MLIADSSATRHAATLLLPIPPSNDQNWSNPQQQNDVAQQSTSMVNQLLNQSYQYVAVEMVAMHPRPLQPTLHRKSSLNEVRGIVVLLQEALRVYRNEMEGCALEIVCDNWTAVNNLQAGSSPDEETQQQVKRQCFLLFLLIFR